MKNVVMYSTPTCHYCNLAKDFFDSHSIEYTVHNVSIDIEKRKEMMDKSGQMGVPVIYIGDDMVLGFDEEKIKDLLGL